MNLPLISVIIPTYNRASMLAQALSSLAAQTLPAEQYQVIVVDDGSSDTTAQVAQSWADRLNLKYSRLEHTGISAAKNLGIAESTGSILLFADDDEIADAQLLHEHLRVHQAYPGENVAVLGYTRWAPHLPTTPVMQYMADIKESPFVYKNLRDGEQLDFTFFWGGRTSCKKSVLVRHGVFEPQFEYGEEDIELGSRLANEAGLQVIFNRRALTYMARAVTYDQLCQSSERKGRSMFLFSRLESGELAQRYLHSQLLDPTTWRPLDLAGAESRWAEIRWAAELMSCRVHEIESALGSDLERHKRNFLTGELGGLYVWTLYAFKIKGFAQALSEYKSSHLVRQQTEPPTAEWDTNQAVPVSDQSVKLHQEKAALQALLGERQAYAARLELHVESLWRELAWREEQIWQVKRTRLWRLGERYWQAQTRFKAWLHLRQTKREGE